jgi:amidase
MSSPDLHYASLLEASDAIRTRKVSPVELTHSMLEWIAKLNPQLHTYATVTTGLALKQAKRAKEEVMRREHREPPHGVPVATSDPLARLNGRNPIWEQFARSMPLTLARYGLDLE